MNNLNTPTIAIITVTYNAASFIKRFSDSVIPVLRREPNIHLFIVDNASADETVTLLEASFHKFNEQFTLVKSGSNLGFGKGCNLGAKTAQKISPDYLWFLNPDTSVDQEAAQELFMCFEAHPNAHFIGSALKNEVGEKRSGAFRFPALLTVFLSRARLGGLDKIFKNHLNTYPLINAPHEADWLTGASFMAKNEAFNKLQGFDPNYFLYFEEVDLFLRAKRDNLVVMFCPSSTVFHESGASTGINKKGSNKPKPLPSYWLESRRYFYLMRYGRGYFLAVDLAFSAGQLLSRLKHLIKREAHSEPPDLLKTIWRYSILRNFKKPTAASKLKD